MDRDCHGIRQTILFITTGNEIMAYKFTYEDAFSGAKINLLTNILNSPPPLFNKGNRKFSSIVADPFKESFYQSVVS